MFDSYYESASETTISPKRAKYEIEENHGMTGGMADFTAECGERDSYSAQAVLNWLGY